MTQKRGLGRGLGALIPGAGSAQRTTATDETAETPATGSGPEGTGEALRTRSHPRTTPEPGETGATSRPVDMFFSGDPVGGGESGGDRAGTSRPSSGRDLADGMARAAAERRAQGSGRRTSASRTRTGRSGGEAESAGAVSDGTGSAEAAGDSAARTGTKKPAGAKKTGGTKKATGTTKSSGTAKASATKGAATSTPPIDPEAPSTGVEGTAIGLVATGRIEETAAETRNEPGAPAAAEASTPPAPTTAPVDPVPDPVLMAHREAEEGAHSPLSENPVAPAESSPAVEVQRVSPTPAHGDDPALDPARATDGPPATAAESAELLPVPGAEFAEIPIHEIRENPRNPRTVFDDDALDELAYSLREVGVLQPVVVRPIPATDQGESFELVMGERRWRAAQLAGLTSIPAIIRETSDNDLLRDALLENLHRSQLNPLEEAAAYSQLLEDFGCTQDELADRIGRSRPQISNTLRLMKLPPLVQRRLASGALSAGHARALLAVEEPSLMEELAQRIVAEGLSVRAVERLVSRGSEPTRPSTPPRRSSYDPRVVDITSRLANRLEAPVKIDVGKRKGRITLEFTNLEDLERLIERIGLEEARQDEAAGGSAQE